ncbi:hypothetical protein FALBO_1033 [Fusarium albosuccineum]|uniref:Uncharacterized protein n=1 Tax=Fusarium albosuccineum TaxID=1237068 RepID=A0A8H4LPQ4_9HYPO|nr:hypothetical protein FALBO_1033 [Fusarium albosuccineum]
MDTPPSTSAASPRKTLLDGRDTRGRLAGGNFAQLVSRFEILDAMSSVGSRRDSHASPKTKPVSFVNRPAIFDRSPHRHLKQSSQGSANTYERSSADSSQISPGHFICPRKASPRLRRAQTLVSKSPTLPKNDAPPLSRRKSVADRIKMFETQGTSAPLQKSTSTRSVSKLAHSKSWQSMKMRLSAPDSSMAMASSAAPAQTQQQPTPRDRNSTPNLVPPSSGQVHLSPSVNAQQDPFRTWRTLMSHPDDSWSTLKRDSFIVTASDASPSYIKSQYIEPDSYAVPLVSRNHMNPGLARDRRASEKTSPSVDETRHHGWVENARKIASSLSKSMSAGTANSYGSRQADGLNTLRSFKFARTSTPSYRSTLPRSRISSLRRKFDYSKKETVTPIPSSGTKHRETTVTKLEKSDWPSTLALPKSFTTSDLTTVTSYKSRSKSYAPRRSKHSVDRPQTPIGRRKTEFNISPLKQKINHFESLNSSHSAPRFPKKPIEKRNSLVSSSQAKNSRASTSKGFKGRLRRISTSCRKSSSEWSTTSSRDPSTSQQDKFVIIETAGKQKDDAESKETPPSPHNIGSIPDRPTLARTSLTNEVSPLELDKRFSLHKSSITCAGFNIDGEAGLYATAAAPAPLFARSRNKPSGATASLGRTTNRFSLLHVRNDFKEIKPFRDTLCNPQRGSTPFVSNAYCELEQPKPVRANELRRLVGLCKDKVRRLSGGRSE